MLAYVIPLCMCLLGGAALALTSAFAIAQDSPESLLPPGFDKPRPSRAPATPAMSGAGAAGRVTRTAIPPLVLSCSTRVPPFSSGPHISSVAASKATEPACKNTVS